MNISAPGLLWYSILYSLSSTAIEMSGTVAHCLVFFLGYHTSTFVDIKVQRSFLSGEGYTGILSEYPSFIALK